MASVAPDPPAPGTPPAPSPLLAARPRPRPKRGRPPALSVVVVNFCQWRNTAHLARQLRRSRSARQGVAELVVVDNNSPPHPLARRMRQWPGVSLRRFPRNHGFARAVNEGCRLAAGDWLLVLNPDMTVPPGFLDDVLVRAAKLTAHDPRAGVIGFGLSDADGRDQASVGPFPSLPNTLGGLVRSRRVRKCVPARGAEPRPVEWVTGCCLLVRRECLERLGGFDDGFFLYYEDVDFCRRARDAGWSVWHDPAVRATHFWPLHARRVPAPLRLMTRHALLVYGSKHWPRWQFRALCGVVRGEARLRQAYAAWAGRSEDARVFRELRKVARDLAAGRAGRARARIVREARLLEACSAPQDGKRP